MTRVCAPLEQKTKPNKRQGGAIQGEAGGPLGARQALEVLGWIKGFPERWPGHCFFSFNAEE